MRKLSDRHRRVLAYRSRRTMRSRRMRDAAKHQLAKTNQSSHSVPDLASISSLGNTTRVRYTLNDREQDVLGRRMTPPAVFCLDENPAETLAFINDFREVRLLSRRLPRSSGQHLRNQRNLPRIGTYTDIAAIRTITPAAALVLAAEFDRARRRNRLGKRGIVNAAEWDSGVARTLVEVGFLKHLHADQPDCWQIDPGPAEIQMLSMLTGNRSEPKEAKSLREGLESLMDQVIDSALGQAIYCGLIEAMDNCVTHAYPKNHSFRYPVEQQRWWMSGSVANGRELEVIFFDQGATIPRTLPHSNKRQAVLDWLARFLNLGGIEAADDGQCIQAAMEVGRSMLGDQGRGNGLAQMQELVDFTASGFLRILSGKGLYIYKRDAAETVGTFDRSIGGTLVHWRFQL